MRIGFGYDVHRLDEGESLILGGIEIAHSKGTVAHSDGDVLIHAVCDALLGAAGEKDIGYHFPDTDIRYKNADSRLLLQQCVQIVRQKGFQVGNLDTSIVMQVPKLRPYIDRMQASLADLLGVESAQVSVKASTTEKLGFVGREEGVSAYAVILLNEK